MQPEETNGQKVRHTQHLNKADVHQALASFPLYSVRCNATDPTIGGKHKN